MSKPPFPSSWLSSSLPPRARRRHTLPLLMTLGAASCPAPDQPPTPPPLALDVPLGAGQARAGKVLRDSELIGGPVAYGRAQQVWKLYNSKARFLIQDVGTSVGLDLYGGNLIDADLVHAGDDGKNGNDLFRETFPIVGLRVPSPTSIEVIADGQQGGAAQLRVHGKSAPSLILPQLDSIGRDLDGEILTDYILDPDVPYLKIVTTYKASGPDPSGRAIVLGDFLSLGASLTVLSPEAGFSDPAGEASFIASVGAHTSYGYLSTEGPLQLPLVDASGTVTLIKTAPLPASNELSITRYLVVGTGDAASVMTPMYALNGQATAHLEGTVRDSAGAPIADARVSILPAPYSATQHLVNQANCDPSGHYALDLPAGDYVAVATAVGRLRGTPTPVSMGKSTTLDLALGSPGIAQLDLGEMRDGKRQPSPGKVSFLGLDVEAPDPRFGPDPTESERNGVHAVAFSPDGTGEVTLKPGTYTAVVSRGVEYEQVRITPLKVPAGGRVAVPADLVRSVDTTGWISGDYHQHSQGSIDAPVPIAKRVIENLAEGVEFPAATDHDNLTDYRPHITNLHAEAFINSVIGDEISVNGVGHFNAYPLSIDAQNPYAKVGAKLWAGSTAAMWVPNVRAGEAAAIVVHVSHPRTKSLAGYFNTVHYDPTTGISDEPLDIFDAVEVNGDLGQASDFLASNDANIHKLATLDIPHDVPTLRDFFSLLNQGRTICALGNSDTHQRNDGTGYPRNFVRFNQDAPAQASGAQLVAALRDQQVTVSNGPFVTATLNGMAALGRAHALNLHGASSATLGIKVQAPTWINVSTIEVYENGRPLTLSRLGPGQLAAVDAGTSGATLSAPLIAADQSTPVVRFDGTVTVKPTRDAWYVVVVRGTGSLLPVGPDSPYAYTNPLYVDLNGDGWTAPGL
jgi:hypothetical protein